MTVHETPEMYAESIQRGRDIAAWHFARMWKNRHDSIHTRVSLRQNINAQRNDKRRIEETRRKINEG